jgi:hypothetical protein
VDLVTIGLVMIGSALLPAFSHPIPKLAEAFAKIGPLQQPYFSHASENCPGAVVRVP